MPSFCAVLDCNDKYKMNGQNVPFHKFPTKNKELLAKWIEFTLRSKDWMPSKWMSICGLHFRDENYRCSGQKKFLIKNAVPTVRTTQCASRNVSTNACKSFNSMESDEESSSCDMDTGSAIDKNGKIDSNCRFCGLTTSTSFVSFVGNFEIYGMIQKCLPALSIRQDDNMPKEICRRCLKRLRNFSHFIDKVLETEKTLQRHFRNEKGNAKSNERILKIKQEPVVRVKQENFDDINAFFPDEVDEVGCGFGEQHDEHDVSSNNHDGSQMDQKFQFCDFPVLNDQDIINNCDIMEIINLSDPFIDITNCENTIAEEESNPTQQQQPYQFTKQQQQQQNLPSAHELLQCHLLNEEHNYANLAEDFKEEWTIRHSCKTEKIEADEIEQTACVEETSSWIEDIFGDTDLDTDFPEDYTDVAATMTVRTTLSEDKSVVTRSNKPIVTSVSSFIESNLVPISNAASSSSSFSSSSNLPSRKKPNIVVLNESIVQSSHAIQFQACTICQSKFFSIDSLNHHYAISHGLQVTACTNDDMQPMVIVPSSNITTWDEEINSQQLEFQSYKTEKDIGLEVKQINSETFTTAMNDDSKAQAQAQTSLTKRSSKNEIKILDMQQTFLQHHSSYTNQFNIEQPNAYRHSINHLATDMIGNIQHDDYNSIDLSSEAGQQDLVANHNDKMMKLGTADPTSSHSYMCIDDAANANTLSTDKKVDSDAVYVETISVDTTFGSSNKNLQDISNKYLVLQKRFRRLQQKCWNLASQKKTSTSKTKQRFIKRSPPFRCRICSAEFNTVFQLLRHKQSTPMHFVRKPSSNFSTSYCIGCEKVFCRKIALQNHMRYICPFLPLRWLKHQILRTFKCRYCRRIKFTHWRLCRKHELRCRNQRKIKTIYKNTNPKLPPAAVSSCSNTSSPKKSNNDSLSKKNRLSKSKTLNSQGNLEKSYECNQCKKVFPSLGSLNQHIITHTSVRVHQCEICRRVFKRKNGLTQHVRGFHMKLKPYECPICKHHYALRGDMTRCKHSSLSRIGGLSDKKNFSNDLE